jgi:hypothetical protein
VLWCLLNLVPTESVSCGLCSVCSLRLLSGLEPMYSNCCLATPAETIDHIGEQLEEMNNM